MDLQDNEVYRNTNEGFFVTEHANGDNHPTYIAYSINDNRMLARSSTLSTLLKKISH